ncbi:ferredoxin-type protein NapF [Skermanella mucosa]|uniref:ferredoxin-type protein NapF n=1 Tax=Skermanella mucosa TaxID=1789672 RepID=UPI00192B2F62|nr:ferredoxin-type protein NapF [Skermanella mucosa]UEM20793.1 ferredoxin-type protein NapF [Skermanella mucosa]
MRDTRIDPGRRSLLRGRLRRGPVPVRPPYASDARVLDACVRCGACADACPEGIVAAGDGGYPEVDFRNGECTFCGDCAEACPAPVFDLTQGAPWFQAAAIADTCFARMGIVCQSCRDACPTGAINFTIGFGGPSRPAVDTDACTGCGACVSPCPAGAVTVVSAGNHKEASDVR